MSRTLQQLSRTEVLEAARTFRGELPGVPNPSTAAVARRFDITETDARALQLAATTPAPKATAPARTIAETVRERLIHESAETLLNRATAAEERGLQHAFSAGTRCCRGTERPAALT